MDAEILFWCVAVFAAFSVGLSKGGLPAIAGLAVPSLSLFMSPITAAGLLLPVYVISDFFALVFYRKNYNLPVLKIGFVGMTFGVILGWSTAHLLIEWIVTLLIGIMGVTYAIRQLLQTQQIGTEPRNLDKIKGTFWCTVAGFTSFISHNGGPPWQIFTLPLGLSKTQFVGTSVIAFTYVNAIKIPPYLFLGQINASSLNIGLFLLVPASIAVYVGYHAVKVIPEKIFFKIVSWSLLFISLKLIWDALKVSLRS